MNPVYKTFPKEGGRVLEVLIYCVPSLSGKEIKPLFLLHNSLYFCSASVHREPRFWHHCVSSVSIPGTWEIVDEYVQQMHQEQTLEGSGGRKG